MKKSFLYLLAVCAFAVAGHTHAVQTLQFNTAAGRATNFGNAAGNTAAGLQYGIIVDTGGDGFDSILQSLSYDIFASSVTTAQFLSVGGVATDDRYFAGSLTIDSTPFGGEGAPGTIANVTSVVYGGAGNIAAGQNFALIWFNDNTADQAGVDRYGFLNLAGMVMPADAGGSTNFGGLFTGADPARNATIVFGPSAGPIPEPSRMMLLGFGLVGLITRRRRK